MLLLLLACQKNKCESKSECEECSIKDCIITYDFNPVCGCNNKTYNNLSEARCNGIEVFTPGECQ